MSEVEATFGEGWVELSFDEGLYPRDAVYGAAYVFIDRCYVHLDRKGDRQIAVRLRGKRGVSVDGEALAGEFENELLGQAWRRQIEGESRAFVEAITTRALAGAAGPPGLDELLAMDISPETAFEDPLGIAMSWEEKYAKKKKAPPEGEAT
jgi:His-Xaa-Ser system protein HxsD